MAELGFALMGCGRIARKHIAALKETTGARLVAVCDPVEARMKRASKESGVPGYASLQMLLEQHSDIDVVNVLTPSGNHPDHVIEAASAGKHVVVEKPMALRLEDADRMIRACDEAGVRLFVVKQNRYNPPVQKVRQAIDQGRFGKFVMGTVRVRWCRRQDYYDQDTWRGTWALDGGVLANQASHHVDLLHWMLGDVESVHAMTSTRLVDIETEDTAVVTLRFANGALGIVEATTATRPKDLEGSLSILGEKGTAIVGGFAVNKLTCWNFSDERAEDADIFETSKTQPDNVYGFGHVAVMQNVVESINHQGAALVDGLEGRRSLELITAIYESVETRREVTLNFRPRHSRLGGDRTS